MSERLEDNLRTGKHHRLRRHRRLRGRVVDAAHLHRVPGDGKRWQTFTVDCPDGMGEAMDVAREWIMSNTFE